MKMSRVNIRIDDQLKEQATELVHELGLDMTRAITVFLIQTAEQRLPFQLSRDPIENDVARHRVEKGEGETYESVKDFMSSMPNED